MQDKKDKRVYHRIGQCCVDDRLEWDAARPGDTELPLDVEAAGAGDRSMLEDACKLVGVDTGELRAFPPGERNGVEADAGLANSSLAIGSLAPTVPAKSKIGCWQGHTWLSFLECRGVMISRILACKSSVSACASIDNRGGFAMIVD